MVKVGLSWASYVLNTAKDMRKRNLNMLMDLGILLSREGWQIQICGSNTCPCKVPHWLNVLPVCWVEQADLTFQIRTYPLWLNQ